MTETAASTRCHILRMNRLAVSQSGTVADKGSGGISVEPPPGMNRDSVCLPEAELDEKVIFHSIVVPWDALALSLHYLQGSMHWHLSRAPGGGLHGHHRYFSYQTYVYDKSCSAPPV